METQRAAKIIRALAAGRDPMVDEAFRPDRSCQQTNTVYTLFVVLKALNRRGHLRADRPSDPNRPKIGATWPREEEPQLRDSFAAHKPHPELTSAHGRTVEAIRARLLRHGLIEKNPMNQTGQNNHQPSAGSGSTPAKSQPVAVVPEYCPLL